jgi:two-component system response regulator MprA
MRGTILIVEDDPEIIGTFGAWLRREGFTVRTATNGEAALSQTKDVDAILLDMHVPLLDGLAFLRRVRSEHPRVSVAIITGDYLLDEAVLRDLERLTARVVFKPLWIDELVALATALVGRPVTA